MTSSSSSSSSPLQTPLRFQNGVESKNRVALAAMTNQQSHDDGTLGDDELRWLTSRADGGFGVVFTCASHVSRDGQGWTNELACFDDSHVDGLRRIAIAMRERGALSMLQIFHGGARAERSVVKRVWSAVAGADADSDVVAGSTDDIARVVNDFAEAAARAERAGFDGVEIHGAHGYLLTQFLSRNNTRSDGWGGDLTGRARLVRAVMTAVRKATKPGFVVGVRLSPEDFGNAKGLDLDESVQVARWLADDGADFIHVSLWQALQNSQKRPDEHALPLFRAALPAAVKIFVAGTLWTRADAESLLLKGADAVALGRSAIVNPSWPNDVKDPAWAPTRPPLTVQELEARGLSARFAGYMARWKGFVRD